LQRMTLGLWNSLTSVAVADRQDSNDETIVNLVNYALEAEPVQVQVKGHFSSIRYESPDGGCCQDLTPVQRGAFTEFVIPALFIQGEVHLSRQTLCDAGGEPAHRFLRMLHHENEESESRAFGVRNQPSSGIIRGVNVYRASKNLAGGAPEPASRTEYMPRLCLLELLSTS